MSDLTLAQDAFDVATTALIEQLFAEPNDLINLSMITSLASCRERIAELRQRQRRAAAQPTPHPNRRKFKR